MLPQSLLHISLCYSVCLLHLPDFREHTCTTKRRTQWRVTEEVRCEYLAVTGTDRGDHEWLGTSTSTRSVGAGVPYGGALSVLVACLSR
ncbi:hypothetical protein BaRGS_00006547 [Batillaria attramentaria]|uniref:Secreted protein n=1 Tax=Batillaria attramentaria TaxID=370345 RepID=A0ABD0LSM4_9CAEN